MLFKSPVYTQASGSIGGLTYAHNSGGMYTRGRGLVTNPNTPAQQGVRAAFGVASANWASLTDTQRTGWTTYAAGTPTTGPLGDPLILTGQQMYNRVNALGGQPNGLTYDDAPTVLGLSMITLTGPALVAEDAGPPIVPGFVEVTTLATDEWAASDDGRLYIYASPAVKPTINFFKGPFQLSHVIIGNTATPVVTVDADLEIQYGPSLGSKQFVAVGEKRFFRFIAVDGTGRPSQSIILPLIAVAP